MKFEQFVDLDRELHFAGETGGKIRRAQTEAAEEGGSDEDLMLAWLGDERPAGMTLGGMVRDVFRWAFVVVVVAGLVSGLGVAAGLLRYDGSQPINVLLFLVTLVGAQILLVPFLLLAFIFRHRLRGRLRLVQGIIRSFMRWVIRTEATQRATGRTAAELESEWGKLQGSGTLYSRVQPLLLLLLFQAIGVAFNLAAIGTLVFLVAISDLTFAWSTTLQVEAGQVYQWTQYLSVPWASVWLEARPSMELVEATRFIRLDGSFLGIPEKVGMMAGGWWPFLVASVFTYGLLPRLLALGVGFGLVRREMRLALKQNARVRALSERLRTPWVVMEEERKEPVTVRVPEEEVGPEKRGEMGRTAKAKVVARDLRFGVIFWAYDEMPAESVVERLLKDSMGAETVFRGEAGHLDKRGEESLRKLGEAVKAGEVDGAVVFFEPFEPPKTDARRFLHSVREVIGREAPLLVLLGEFDEMRLVPVAEADQETWERAIAAEGDPFLFFKTIGTE